MPQERIYELIARQLSGEASTAELDELHEHLQQNGGDQYLYEMLSAYWLQHPDLLQEEANDEEERFQRIVHATTPPTTITASRAVSEAAARTISFRRWLSYAAMFIGLAGCAYFIYWYKTGNKSISPAVTANNGINEVVAKPGSRSKLVLPDGTQVWLNAESRITYQHSFNTKKREVSLEGEAFFDVTHDAERPFIVHTSGIDIKVLGTAFNVKSYASDETIETTLLRGSIEVVKKDDPAAPKVILRPHEKLVFNKHELVNDEDTATHAPIKLIRVQEPGISIRMLPKNRPDSVMKETSWLYNKLNFDGDSFEELAAKMERWYDVHITIRNERLKRVRLKGSFDVETIRQALEALRVSVPFEYEMEGGEVTIR
jgi:transmembrane sensor